MEDIKKAVQRINNDINQLDKDLYNTNNINNKNILLNKKNILIDQKYKLIEALQLGEKINNEYEPEQLEINNKPIKRRTDKIPGDEDYIDNEVEEKKYYKEDEIYPKKKSPKIKNKNNNTIKNEEKNLYVNTEKSNKLIVKENNKNIKDDIQSKEEEKESDESNCNFNDKINESRINISKKAKKLKKPTKKKFDNKSKNIIESITISKNLDLNTSDISYSWKDMDFITKFQKKNQSCNLVYLVCSKRGKNTTNLYINYP